MSEKSLYAAHRAYGEQREINREVPFEIAPREMDVFGSAMSRPISMHIPSRRLLSPSSWRMTDHGSTSPVIQICCAATT